MSCAGLAANETHVEATSCIRCSCGTGSTIRARRLDLGFGWRRRQPAARALKHFASWPRTTQSKQERPALDNAAGTQQLRRSCTAYVQGRPQSKAVSPVGYDNCQIWYSHKHEAKRARGSGNAYARLVNKTPYEHEIVPATPCTASATIMRVTRDVILLLTIASES